MCYFIAIEDLFENALINKMIGDDNFISYKELREYGARVVSILSEEGEKAVLVLSREKTAHMLSDYSKYLEEREEEGSKGIGLKADVEIEELIDEIRGYMPLEVMMAFIKAVKPEMTVK